MLNPITTITGRDDSKLVAGRDPREAPAGASRPQQFLPVHDERRRPLTGLYLSGSPLL